MRGSSASRRRELEHPQAGLAAAGRLEEVAGALAHARAVTALAVEHGAVQGRRGAGRRSRPGTRRGPEARVWVGLRLAYPTATRKTGTPAMCRRGGVGAQVATQHRRSRAWLSRSR